MLNTSTVVFTKEKPVVSGGDTHLLSLWTENPKLQRDIRGRFGVRLRELRRERSLTQLRMAVDFGIDRSYISDIERGQKAVTLVVLEVIALGFKMSLSELMRNL